MTPPPYLDMLDELLRPSLVGLSEPFVKTQVRFVAGCQQPDGGFAGRQGGSDLYYTDFALRTLDLLAPDHAAFGRAAGYLTQLPGTPRDIVECFNVLNSLRLLRRHGRGPASRVFDSGPLLKLLYSRLLPQGGLARFSGDQQASAYHTFIGALCFQMMGMEMPAREDAVRAVALLKRPGGGYVELAGQSAPQTSATAAAVAFLTMHDAVTPENAVATTRFLAGLQSADGGLQAHAAVEGGDLLSTFTGLATLLALDGLQQIDAAGVARFLRGAAHPSGGFLARAEDDAPDVEYTYYGVGTAALLRAILPDE